MDSSVDASQYGWVEMVLFYGVILFFAFRELWLLRRHRKTQEAAKAQDGATAQDKREPSGP